MATDPHPYQRHWDGRPGCAVCGSVKTDPIHTTTERNPMPATLIPGTDVKALPTNVTGRDQRSRETRIPTSDPDVFLALSTFHHGNGKQFISQVMGVRVKHDPIFSAFTCSPMDTVAVHKTPVARFSAKALDAAHAEALTKLAEEIAVVGPDFFQPVLDATPEA